MNITVFLADDHAMFREGLKLLIEAKPDIKVIGEASNGRAAVREVARLQPDVVLMDVFMPELNGLEATGELSQRCPSVKVIILSMHTTNEHVFRALKAGARGYVLKEMTGEEIIKAIRAVHVGKRYLCESISTMVIDDYMKYRETGEQHDELARLSRREREILQLLAEGKSNTSIAETLFLSQSTVGTYRFRIMRKLGIEDLSGLIRFAINKGLVSPD